MGVFCLSFRYELTGDSLVTLELKSLLETSTQMVLQPRLQRLKTQEGVFAASTFFLPALIHFSLYRKATWKLCNVLEYEEQVGLFEHAISTFGQIDVVVCTRLDSFLHLYLTIDTDPQRWCLRGWETYRYPHRRKRET